MSSSKSDGQSNGFIHRTVIKVVKVFKSDLTVEDEKLITKYVVYPIRKYAHVFEYFVLYILTFLFINCYDLDLKRKIIYSMIVCVLYACSDEFHQMLVPGRDGSVRDVFVDSFGSSIGLLICYIIGKRKLNKN
jgi:VanZ family protein